MSLDQTAANSPGGADLSRTNVPEFAVIQRQQFDEYTIVGKLGHGGMAEVLLAISEGVSGFRKLVVVKRLHDYMNDEEAVVQMFLDEAKLASRLNHPNVVATLKVGMANTRYFLAMEYLEGQPLNRVLRWGARKKKLLPIPLAARVMTDTLDGLHYAHTAKDYDGSALAIIHRDVSPHNIFITYDGTVKILDFGIAKAATQESRTGTGLVKGKFGYMAPEQARADDIDARADVWSAGVVMWEMLTGYRLFKGNTDAATLQMTMTAEIPAMVKHRPEVPQDLERIVRKALQRDPSKRYQNAREMKEDIDDWLATQTRSASRTSLTNYMHDVFGEQIEETRRMIKDAVDREGEGPQKLFNTMHGSVSGLTSPGTPSAVSAIGAVDGSGGSRTLTAMVGEESSGSRSLRIAVGALFVISAVTIGLLLVVLTRKTDDRSAAAGAPSAAATAAPSASATAQPPAKPSVEVAPPATATPSASASAAATATAAAAKTVAPVVGGPRVAAAPTAAPKKPEEDKAVEFGTISINTNPWSNVSVGGRSGTTPFSARLPAGVHTVVCTNPELGITRTFSVEVKAGQTVSRSYGIQ